MAQGKGFQVYLPADKDWLKEAIKSIAKQRNRSFSEIVIEILERNFREAAEGTKP